MAPLVDVVRPPLSAQGNMAQPNMVAWHEKEGKPQAGMLEITPGSTLVVLEPEKGAWRAQLRSATATALHVRTHSHRRLSVVPACLLASVRTGFFLRTYNADQLWIRVPPGTSNLASEHAVSDYPLAHPTRRDVRIAGASRARPHPASANHLCLDRPQSWAEALTNLIAGLTPVAADDGGPIKDRLVPACKLGSSK